MITSNVIHRTFQIRFKTSQATCFTLDVRDRQCLITALHVVKNIEENDVVQIRHQGQWKNLDTRRAWTSEEQDIAVLVPGTQLSPLLPLVPGSKGLVFGQDVYFCGYPYGLREEANSQINRDFPFPFVRKGIISSLGDGSKLFVDAIGNKGFSGGPVLFQLPGSNDFRVAGVITNSLSVEEPILKDGQDTGLRYVYNIGIVVAHYLDGAVKYLLEKPTGLPIGK